MTIPSTLLRSPSYLLVLGDGVAGGQNASGGNQVGGKGYARLLVNNHPDYPAWVGHDLSTQFPAIQLLDLTSDGSTITRTRADLERSISLSMIPAFIQGDLVVLIHAGGLDFLADVATLTDAATVQQVAASARMQLASMIALLQVRYEKPGHAVIVLVDNIVDPTDGTGAIASTFQSGSCTVLQRAPGKAAPRQVLANLAHLNAEIAAEVAARRAWLVDAHAVLLGHGMTAASGDRWIDLDCQKLLDAGHDALRRQAWKLLTDRGH
jgi:hypothetical protein